MNVKFNIKKKRKLFTYAQKEKDVNWFINFSKYLIKENFVLMSCFTIKAER